MRSYKVLSLLVSFYILFCISSFVAPNIFAACAECGDGGCGQPVQCCTSTSYDPCNANGRTCTNPCDGVECAVATDCPDKYVAEQCGVGQACSVGKQCNSGVCQYYCTGYPPCGVPTGDTTQPVCVQSEFIVNPIAIDVNVNTFTISGRATDNVLVDHVDLSCLGCHTNCSVDAWYPIRTGIPVSGPSAPFTINNVTLPAECNARMSSVGTSVFAVRAVDNSGNASCCSPDNNCNKQIWYADTAGGLVTQCGSSNIVNGARVYTYNDTWDRTTTSSLSDGSGRWYNPRFLRNGDYYAVNRVDPPVGNHFVGSAKTTGAGWNWNYCVNPNVGTSPWADTLAGSNSYQCQKRIFSNSADCAGPGAGVWQRCNFCFDVLSCAANMSVTCTDSYTARFNWTPIPNAEKNVLRVNNTTNGWQGQEGAGAPNPTGFPGDRWVYVTPPAGGIVVTPGVQYDWSVQGVLSGETYPFYGCQQSGPSFICPTPVPACGIPSAPVILSPSNGSCLSADPSYSIRQDYAQTVCYPHDAWARILRGTNNLFTSGWNANRTAIAAPGGTRTFVSWEAGVGDIVPPTYVSNSLATGDYIFRTLTAAKHPSTGVYTQSASNAVNFSIDKDAPSMPTDNRIDCRYKNTSGGVDYYEVQYFWNGSTDVGCGSLTITYDPFIYSPVGYSTPTTGTNTPWVGTVPNFTTVTADVGATDSIGNYSGWTTGISKVVNANNCSRTLPTAPVLNAVPASCQKGPTSKDISVTAGSQGNEFQFYVYSGGGCSGVQIGNSGWIDATTAKAGWTIPADLTASGTYSWKARSRWDSSNGDTNNWSSCRDFSVDNLAPTPGMNCTCEGSGTNPGTYKVNCFWSSGSDGTCNTSYTYNESFTTTPSGGSWIRPGVGIYDAVTTTTVDNVLLSDTLHAKAQTKDGLGNLSGWGTQFDIQCIPGAPYCTNPSLLPASSQKENTTITFASIAKQDDGELKSCNLNIDGAQVDNKLVTGSSAACSLSWTPTVSNTTGDTYDYVTQIKDNFGNTGTCQSGTYCIDSLPPSSPAPLTSSINSCTTWNWTQATEDGCSGFSHYFLQCNSASDFSGQYYCNTSISSRTTVSTDVMAAPCNSAVTPPAGSTVYCRIRSEDNLSNYIGWTSGNAVCPAEDYCASTDSNIAACIGTNPSLQSRYDIGSQVQIRVTGGATVDSGWQSNPNPYTYTPTLGTGSYTWGSRAGANPLESTCITSAYTSHNFSVDKTKPSQPVQTSGAYNSVSEKCTFTWTASTDVGCGACSGKACKYFVQGWWTDSAIPGNWFVNDGEWTPSSVLAPSYEIPCTGRDGERAYFKAIQAKDSIPNISTPDQTLEGTCVCGALSSCDSSDLSTIPACIGTNPSLQSRYDIGSQVQIRVTGDVTGDSGWQSSPNPYTYTPTLGTGNYAWGSRAGANPLDSTCSTSAYTSQPAFSVDKTGPQIPVLASGVYNSGSRACDFSWTRSTDTGCGNCGGYACSYDLLAHWETGSDTSVTGVTNNYYYVDCSSNEGQTASLKANVAKDSFGNISGQQANYGSCACGCWTSPVWTDYGSCSASCGTGTETRACDCSGLPASCRATAQCSSPVASCNGTDGRACCISSAPEKPPVGGITITQNNSDIDLPSRIDVDWTFGSLDGCSEAWGYVCSGRSNSFTIKIDGANKQTGITSTERDITLTVGSWGAHTLEVCALNGYATTCSDPKNFTITAPVCTVTGENPTTGCFGPRPTLSAQYGGGADQIQFAVSVNDDFSTPPDWSCNSGWQSSPNPYNYSCNLTTGTYYWVARANSTASPVKCSQSPLVPNFSIEVDTTGPSIPGGRTITFTSDPACKGKSFATYTWNATSDGQCGGLGANPYQSQMATDPSFNAGSIVTGWSQSWGSARTQTTTESYVGGTDLYARVQSQDSLNNLSGWNTPEDTATVPTPTLYPTIHIEGPLQEDMGTGGTHNCSVLSVVPSQLVLYPTLPPTAGITANCSATSNVKYECNINLNNQLNPCLESTGIVVGLGGMYPGYDSVEWRQGDNCSGNSGATISVDSGDIVNNKPLFVDYGDHGWFKLSNTSYTNRQSTARSNPIPYQLSLYDSDDDISSHSFIIKSAGIITQNSLISVGVNAQHPVTNAPIYSSTNWYTSGYTNVPDINETRYLEYVRARKGFTVISQLADITADGIYVISSDVTINSGNVDSFANKKVILIADNKTITVEDNFTPASSTVALIGNRVQIGNNATSINAVLIGNTVHFGTSNQALKINGNVSSFSVADVTRIRQNARQPSVFVSFDIAKYLDLLPYLSTIIYDRR